MPDEGEGEEEEEEGAYGDSERESEDEDLESLRFSGASTMFLSHGLENLEMEQFRLLQVVIFSVLIFVKEN